MTLRPPDAQGSRAKQSNELQREVADRITKRWEAKREKELQAARIANIKNYLAILFLLGVAGGGFYAWKSGILEQWFAGCDPAASSPGTGSALPRQSPPTALPQVENGNRPGRCPNDDRMQAIDRYAKVVKSFGTVSIDYWKNAPESDRPAKAGKPIDYHCLIPDERGNPLILVLHTVPGAKMSVKRISASAGVVDFPADEFNRLSKISPYLIAREGRAYFAASRTNSRPDRFPFPADGEVNPSKIMFGALYGAMADLKVPKPGFRYSVKFESNGGFERIDVASVGFGDTVARKMFEEKVSQRYGLDISSDAAAIDAILRMGKVEIAPL